MYPSVSIIIPSFNGEKHLRDFLSRNLEAAANYKGKAELIVVDDRSSDGSVSFMKEISETDAARGRFRFFINDKKGTCSARNLGVARSENDFILFIDNDVLLEKDYLDKAAPYLKDGVYAVACAGYNYYTRAQQDGVKLYEWKRGFPRFTGNIMNDRLDNLRKSMGEPVLSGGIQGAYFFMSKARFRELGGYDEDLFEPYLLEETDLIYRGMKRGWPIVYAPDLAAYHKTGGTIASKTNPRTKILSRRARIIFSVKNIHDPALFASHVLFVFLHLFDPYQIKALKETARLLKTAFKKRRIEKAAARVSDRDLLAFSKKLKSLS